jgi:hypothetical protein
VALQIIDPDTFRDRLRDEVQERTRARGESSDSLDRTLDKREGNGNP